MKPFKRVSYVVAVVALAVAVGCGGGGGASSSSSAGTVSFSMTDAKPVLPENVTNCFVTIDAVMVHKPGGGWQSLPMVETPYTIDLLQFTDGISKEFVPPVALESGKYTQVRLSVAGAKLRFIKNAGTTEDVTLTIPSGNLKTDKNFDFDVEENAAVDITIDFDLSQSIVVTGPAGSPSYMLKPVLHIVETSEAAAIEGTIANGNFVDDYAVITLIALSNGEEYTRVRIDIDTSDDATETAYSIFWLVPNQDYRIEIDYNPETGDPADPPDASKDVSAADLGPGETATVNFP